MGVSPEGAQQERAYIRTKRPRAPVQHPARWSKVGVVHPPPAPDLLHADTVQSGRASPVSGFMDSGVPSGSGPRSRVQRQHRGSQRHIVLTICGLQATDTTEQVWPGGLRSRRLRSIGIFTDFLHATGGRNHLTAALTAPSKVCFSCLFHSGSAFNEGNCAEINCAFALWPSQEFSVFIGSGRK